MSEFVNPYTFIPLKRRMPFNNQSDEERLTGVITCKLTAKTPVIVPASQIEVGNPNSVSPCFKIDGEPVIPGSSLRGPIRSVYEALTNSCMRASKEQLSSAGGRKLPGLLRWDPAQSQYFLYKAKRYRVVQKGLRKRPDTGALWVTGDEVFITTGPEKRSGDSHMTSAGVVTTISEKPDARKTTGYYLRVNQMYGKTANSPSVFVEDERIRQPVDRSFVESLGKNIELLLQNAEDSDSDERITHAKNYKRCYDSLLQGGTLPVWYSYERLRNGTYAFHLAWAQLSRNVYPKAPVDYVSELGLSPCTTAKGSLCPACELFGFVPQQDSHSSDCRAGKVRFSDARPIGKASTKSYLLPPLLGPKVHATEFYLRNVQHRQSFSPMTDGTQLAGRKMYWHSPTGIRAGSATSNNDDAGDFVARVEAIQPDSEFHFDVYFDEVSRQQLNELVYVLTLGQAWHPKDKNHWHKIGHGKPIGAGSVLIELENVIIRKIEGGTYRLASWDPYRLPSAGTEGKLGTVEWRLSHLDEVLKVTNSAAIGGDTPIDYPRVCKNGDIFGWFSDNHNRGGREGETIVGYKRVLPNVTDSSQAIPRDVGTLHSRLLQTAHPDTASVLLGSIESFVKNTDGTWRGFIKPDGGGRNIYFQARENPQIVDTQGFKPHARVSYETDLFLNRRKGQQEKHAINVRLV